MNLLSHKEFSDLIVNKKERFYRFIYSYLHYNYIYIPNSKDIKFLNEYFYTILVKNNICNYFSNRKKEKIITSIFSLIHTDINIFHNYYEIIKDSLLSEKSTKKFLEDNINNIYGDNFIQFTRSIGIAIGDSEEFKNNYKKILEKDYNTNLHKICTIIDLLKEINCITNDKIRLLNFFNNSMNANMQNKIIPSHSDIDLRIVENPNNLLDLISNVVKQKKISDDLIIKLIQVFKNNQINEKLLLSYCSSYVLSDFTNIYFNFINRINKNESIVLKDYIHKDKKRYFYDFYVELFLSLEKEKAMEIYNHTAYLNISLSKEIKNFLSFENQKTSHYIQGAYLLRIMGNEVKLEVNNEKINVSNRKVENPYCIPYFYGNSIPKDSIEEKLSIVENTYMNYLDYELSKNTIASFKDKLIFILNYTRTPDFLSELQESYSLFHHEYIKMLYQKGDKYKKLLVENTLNKFTYHERVIYFRELQMNLINFILGIIKNINNSERYDEKDFEKDITKLILFNQNENRKDAQFFYTFIQVIYTFLAEKYYIEYLNIDIKRFTYNLFIMKKHKQKYLFSNLTKIDFVYFPFDKSKIVIFTKVKGVKLDVNCMLDLPNLPFIANMK